MALNKHFTYDFEDRPKLKLWLLKPDFTRIERITGITKPSGTFKHTNINQLTFQIAPVVFDELQHEEKPNPLYDLIKNKYLIEYEYNGFKDTLVIDDIKKVSNDTDTIEVVADSLCTELAKKSANEIELLGSSLKDSMDKVLESYAPLWSVKHIDSKLNDVKRELTAQNTTVMGVIDQLNSLFDSVAIFNNNKREVSFYHKDNIGVNRGLRIRENSYLKSFEDSTVSKDVITRLYPFGNNGLTIQSVNPAGTDYIEDFSYFLHPFKRDIQRNVIRHSDYMSDDLCHALLDYQDYYDSKKEQAEAFTKRYTDILAEHSNEKFKLNQLSAVLERQTQRKELLTPKSEYVDLGIKTSNFEFIVEKSSYYVLMLQNLGNLARVRFQGQVYDVPTEDWLYLKIDSGDFQNALKYKDKLKYKIEFLSSKPQIKAVITRSSKTDYDDTESDDIEKKYNYEKYKALVNDQKKIVASIERRMKNYENEKRSLIDSMNPKNFLSPTLYKEREQFVYSGIWTEDNHTEAKELYDDAIKEMKKQRKLNRTLNINIVNFIQSLEDRDNWDKLIAGDVITFSNKVFGEKLKAYITDIQINFEDNTVTLTVSDVIDYKNTAEIVSELIASTASNAAQVNFHKEQIRSQTGKITRMSQLIEAEWDANKKRVLAGNETVDIGSHGVKIISNENPSEFVIMVGGVIAMTKDNGETFKTGITPNGVNAEMLIGKMLVGETLTMENESGTFRFDKDGLTIDKAAFHLTTSEGDSYFDKLKREMKEENKVQNDLIRDEFRRRIDKTVSEALDVENIIDETSKIIRDTFADGIITDVERRLIQETLATLEKENKEYLQQVEFAYNHPYITSDDIIKLDEAMAVYNGMYDALIMNINESINDSLITPAESKSVNDALIQYREEVKEITVLVQQIMERIRENQINQALEESYDYADRIKKDITDEINDLNKSVKDADEYIRGAFSDNIFDSIEIETIKTLQLVVISELEDVTNRYNTVYANEQLSEDLKETLKDKHDTLVGANKTFVDYVNEMIEDRKSDEQEKLNYKSKYESYKAAIAEFEKVYSESVLAISSAYSKSVENKIVGNFNSLKEELNNDLTDLRQNMSDLKELLGVSFEDGVVTAQEKVRIEVHLDMLDRELNDVEEQYKVLVANKYSSPEIKNLVGTKRTAYIAVHGQLRNILNRIIQDGAVSDSEKQEINTYLTQYSQKLGDYTASIIDALNKMSVNVATDVAASEIEKFNGVLDKVNEEIDTLQKQVDGAIESHYYNHAPTLQNAPAIDWESDEDKESHVGDFFLDTQSGIAYRFLKIEEKFKWEAIEDQVITQALNNSQNALDLVDHKRRVFVRQPEPPYEQGDLWAQGVSGDFLVAVKDKRKGQFYEANDWAKASKYTDDTTANRAISELNEFKSTVNQDLEKLKALTKKFNDEVAGSFEDKIITTEENASLTAIAKMMTLEKTRIQKQGQTVRDSENLPARYKGQVASTLNNLLGDIDKVIKAVTDAIGDKKITEQEQSQVDRAFESYNNSLSEYERIINEAIQGMIVSIADRAAKRVEEKFEEWKSSEFSVESERIASRVSGSQWQTTYLPQVNQKIDSIQVGNRNLIRNFNETVGIFVKPNTAYIDDPYRMNIPYGQKLNIRFYDELNNPLKPNTDYIFTLHESSDNVSVSITYNRANSTLINFTNEKVIKFNTKNYRNFVISIQANSNYQYVGKMSLFKGNTELDWTPAPEDIEQELESAQTKIQASSSFIEQYRDKITQSVTRNELTAELEKVTVNEKSYSLNGYNAVTLTESDGSPFDSNYSYEVVAKTKNVPSDTTAVVVFTGRGYGRGFDMTILDQKGTTGVNPKFEMAGNTPTISLYSSYNGVNQVDVIYTKYLGTASTLKTAKSLIDQKADSLTLEVNRLKEQNGNANLLSNTDFSTPNAVWKDISKRANFSFPPLSEMSINSNENLLLNNGYNNKIVGSSNYKRVEMKLAKPLEVGSFYTLEFETENNANIRRISVIPHFPESQRYDVNVNSGRISLRIYATAPSTSLLFYVGLQTQTDNSAKMSVSKATLIKGNEALPYEPNKSHRVAKMTYDQQNNWPALVSNYIPVGDNLDFAVGDELTLSAYIYVPQKTKDLIKNVVYIELATYENTKQNSNPMFARYEINPQDIIADTWFRVSATGEIPGTSNNGDTNYFRALLRFDGTSNSLNSDIVIYYGLPMLERGNKVSPWTRSTSDKVDTDSIASRISLTPESIELLTENLRINTDSTVITNTQGNVTIQGDTISLSSNSSNDSVSLSPSGITMVKDGVKKISEGYDFNTAPVQPYEPQFYSATALNSEPKGKYNFKNHVDSAVGSGIYYLDWGTYDYARSKKQLIENNGTAWARVNRYTYEYTKRYLVIELSCWNNDKNITLNLRWRTETGETTLHEEKIKSTDYVFPKIVIDLEKKLGRKPDNRSDFFELQVSLSGAKATYHTGHFRIRRSTMTDYKP